MSIINNFLFMKNIDAIKKNNFRVPILPKVRTVSQDECVRVAPFEVNYIYVNEILDFLINKIKEKENHIFELQSYLFMTTKKQEDNHD